MNSTKTSELPIEILVLIARFLGVNGNLISKRVKLILDKIPCTIKVREEFYSDGESLLSELTTLKRLIQEREIYKMVHRTRYIPPFKGEMEQVYICPNRFESLTIRSNRFDLMWPKAKVLCFDNCGFAGSNFRLPPDLEILSITNCSLDMSRRRDFKHQKTLSGIRLQNNYSNLKVEGVYAKKAAVDSLVESKEFTETVERLYLRSRISVSRYGVFHNLKELAIVQSPTDYSEFPKLEYLSFNCFQMGKTLLIPEQIKVLEVFYQPGCKINYRQLDEFILKIDTRDYQKFLLDLKLEKEDFNFLYGPIQDAITLEVGVFKSTMDETLDLLKIYFRRLKFPFCELQTKTDSTQIVTFSNKEDYESRYIHTW